MSENWAQFAQFVKQAKEKSTMGDAATKAQEIVNGRAENYGEPEDNFAKIAKVWTGLLADKLQKDEEIFPEDVACLMAGLKLCRETWMHDEDNLVDTIGYILCLERIHDDS